MAFSEEETKRVLAVIQQRVPEVARCPVCGQHDWTLADGLVRLTLQEERGVVVVGGRNMPCVALICKRCGNTLLLNVIVLGLRDLAAKKGEPEENSES